MKEALTINLNGEELTIEGIYVPEEPMVMYDSQGDGNPGEAESFEISSVTYKGTDITQLLEELNTKIWCKGCTEIWEVLENKCLEQINNKYDI